MRRMNGAGIYLDLVMLINGGMDAFILILTGKFIHATVRPLRLAAGVFLGEIPVLLACFAVAPWTTVSKWLIPFLMVGVSFSLKRPAVYFKALLSFWLLSAGLGGFVYALWGWTQFGDVQGNSLLVLALHNLWILPLGALTWWLCQRLWLRWQKRNLVLEQVLYRLEIDFDGEGREVVCARALLDTGNNLRDPLTGVPVILLEEETAAAALPDDLRSFLKGPWRDYEDPWPLLWKADPALLKRLVFIPFQGIERRSWLLGIRPERVTCLDCDDCSDRLDEKESRPLKATVALVKQVLSSEGEYQALIQPEHVQKGGDR